VAKSMIFVTTKSKEGFYIYEYKEIKNKETNLT
jgi:hypothetical protein